MSKRSATRPPDAGAAPSARRQRRRLVLAGAASLALAAAPQARAQGWPAKPLRLILTAPPGSSIDVLGRLVAEQLRDRLGQPVVAENRPQAGGTVGTDAVAKAAPDGYTIGLSFTGPLATAPFLNPKLAYDPARDLAPVVLVGTAPNILAVHSAVPAASLRELIAYVRARPGQLNYASVGNGSASHLAMELLKSMAGLYVVHIPFNGAPPAVQATAAGEVQMIMSNPTSLLPMIQAGRIRPLAVTGPARWPQMKELPTVAESGFAGFEAVAWNGFVAPAGTPREVVARLNREINAVLSSPPVRPRIEAAGWDVAGGTAEAFAAFMQAERARWRPVVERSGARLD
jgi:tripartite-type tricarboxylate transporter receptor subunit TctC